MNDKIRKLYEEAKSFYLTDEYILEPSKEDCELIGEKFAELIIAECCDWIDGSPATDAGQLLLTKSFIIDNLKGHFGVEK